MSTFISQADFISELIAQIKSFEELLDPSHQAKICAFSSGGNLLFADSIAYKHPDLVCFYGHDSSGNVAASFCHISQINFSVISVPLESPKEKRPIGFMIEPFPESKS